MASRFHQQPILLLSNEDSDIAAGISEACTALGWRIVNLKYVPRHLIPLLSPVGAILGKIPWGDQLDLLRELGIPIVNMAANEDEHFLQDGRVYTDRRSAGACAAAAFLQRGFRNLAYVALGELPRDPLRLGFCETAEKHQAVVHRYAPPPLDERDAPLPVELSRLQAFASFLADAPKPLAILAYNCRMAIRMMAACGLAGLSIPEDVVLAAVGEQPGLFKTAPTPLSGIDLNGHEHGRQAVRLLKTLVDGAPPPPKPIMVPAKGFVERRSTEMLAVADQRVARALRFIWDHASQPINVDNVARETGVSRRKLERAFRRSLNRGISEELHRKRLEISKDLLRSSELTTDAIAKSVGYSSRHQLNRNFRAAFEMTPNEYRKSLRTG